MSFHTCGNALLFTGSTTVGQDITPIPDGLMLVQDAHFVPQYDMPLLWALGMGAHLISVQLISPTLRQICNPYIRPLEGNQHPGNLAGVADYSQNPLTLKGLEELEVFGLDGTAEVVTFLMGLQKTPLMPCPQGNIVTMQGVGAATLVVNVWNQVPIVWQNSLPAGMYACVGLAYVGVSAQAARLTFQNQWERPGAPGVGLSLNQERSMFRRGYLGVWGQFSSYAMPTVECLASAADTVQTVYLDLIKVA